MVSEVALRRGARLKREGDQHVALDAEAEAIVWQVAVDLADWLGYASVDALRAATPGDRLRRLRGVRA